MDLLSVIGELDEDDQFLSLVDEGSWETLELEGTVTVDQDTVEGVFPFDEWEETPGRLALVMENPLARIEIGRYSPTRPSMGNPRVHSIHQS